MNRFIVYPLIGAAELWCQLSCHLSSLSRHESRIESVTSSVQGVSDSNWAKDTSSQEGDFLFALCKSSLEARYFGSSWPLRLSEPRFVLTALMFTPLERLVLGCIGVFASFAVFYFLWTYFILFQLLFPTTVFILGGTSPTTDRVPTTFRLLSTTGRPACSAESRCHSPESCCRFFPESRPISRNFWKVTGNLFKGQTVWSCCQNWLFFLYY